MKALMATAAAVALLAGIATASAQNAPAKTEKSDQSMSMGGGSGEMKKPTKHRRVAHVKRHRRHGTTGYSGATTGSDRIGTIGGPRNDPSIHQSIGRDSRGTPKGPGNQ